MPDVPVITLNDGVEIPQLGFGTWPIAAADAERVVGQALEIGYRHIDTAQMYGNEAGVGAAVRASGLPREDVFVTSKLDNAYHRPHDALEAFDRTIDRLDIGYVDLFLIHWPRPNIDVDYVDTWRAMEQIRASGRVRSIGVSNFEPAHLRRLFEHTDTVPSVNQVEVHPYFDNTEVRAFNTAHGIATEAWSPIARGDVLVDPVVTDIAARVGATPAQVVLRWHLQRGDIVFPKSSDPGRMRENFDLFGIELDDDDMGRIGEIDRDERQGDHPNDV